MRDKFDKIWLGIALGLLMPLFFGAVFMRTMYHGDASIDSLLRFMSGNSMIVKFLFVTILPDMGAVFVLNSLEMWRACRGMFAALGLFVLMAGTFLIINM